MAPQTDENKNTNNQGVFGSGAPSISLGGAPPASDAQADRERRLALRDQERARRFAGDGQEAATNFGKPG
jgi:hypothetical protein